MPTMPGPAGRPHEDLTTSARIRDAAMAQFADRGFKATTMKNIAEAAGVSIGLVQHHFGTKNALREACNDAALTVMRRKLELARQAAAQVGRPDFTADLNDTDPLMLRYVLRLLVEGDPEADDIYDEMADGIGRFLSEVRPDLFPAGSQVAQDGGTILVAMKFGTALLEAQVGRRMGTDLSDRTSVPRMGLVMLDIFTAMGDWVASETGQQARAAVSAYVLDRTEVQARSTAARDNHEETAR